MMVSQEAQACSMSKDEAEKHALDRCMEGAASMTHMLPDMPYTFLPGCCIRNAADPGDIRLYLQSVSTTTPAKM